MKKFISTFATVAMFFTLSSGVAYSMDIEAFLQTNKQIVEEFGKYEKDPVFRDMDFFIRMSVAHLQTMNSALGKNLPIERKREVFMTYAAILKTDYISMEKYIEMYVIMRAQKRNEAIQKSRRLLELIREASNLLN